MDNIRKHIDCAMKILSSLYVNSDAVDVVAAVRQELRAAKAAVINIERENAEEGESDD